MHWLRLAPLGLLVVSAGCKLDMDKIKASIQSELAQEGVNVTSLDCPGEHKPKAGEVFECTAHTADGVAIPIRVEQVDDKGNIRWDAIRTLRLTRAEAHLGELLGKEAGGAVTVECGEGVWVADPGETRECTATVSGGETVTLVLTMGETLEDLEWKVKGAGEAPSGEVPGRATE